MAQGRKNAVSQRFAPVSGVLRTRFARCEPFSLWYGDKTEAVLTKMEGLRKSVSDEQEDICWKSWIFWSAGVAPIRSYETDEASSRVHT
jgi:hypothetical protein